MAVWQYDELRFGSGQGRKLSYFQLCAEESGEDLTKPENQQTALDDNLHLSIA